MSKFKPSNMGAAGPGTTNSLRNNLMREMIAPQSALENNPKAKLLPLDRIASNPFQVRQDFSSPEAVAALEELAADIVARGVLQPILVRPLVTPSDNGPSRFEIVAGERRYRAARLAGLTELPVIVESMTNEQARMASLTENLQRRDLNFREEVDFLAELDKQRQLSGQGGETDIARLIHKSRTYVAKRLKLAGYPELVERIATGDLTINQAYDEAIQQERENISDENHNVFPGNDSVKGRNKSGERSARTVTYSFRARLVPFVRLREAVVRLNQEFEALPEDERTALGEEIKQLEEELAKLRDRLS